MADTKVSGLASVAAFATSLEFPVNDSGTSHKISGSQLQAAFPQGTLTGGYAQVTANQGTYTAATDLTSLTVTVTPGSGRRLKITAWAPQSSSVSTDVLSLTILEGATVLQQSEYINNFSGGISGGVPLMVILTPTAAAHTYKLQGQRVSGSGNVTMLASTTAPAFILVEDIGT